MKTRVLILLPFLFLSNLLSGQAELQVEGSLQIGDSGNPNPEPGTVRWTGLNFEGWNGLAWVRFGSLQLSSIITDSDGNDYRTVTIGNQEWMAENLRTSRFTDGSEIPMINDPTSWLNANYGAWCWYDTINTDDLPYGKLYNWYAINDTRGVCPSGWHVPTDAEWTALIDYLDPAAVNSDSEGTQSTVAGGKMKEAGTIHWRSPNTGATNESGFTGLPGGGFDPEDTFDGKGSYAYWWSSTDNGNDAWIRQLGYWYGDAIRSTNAKHQGLPVRCLRD